MIFHQHLGECLDHLSREAAAAERPAEVALALWFHDAFYDVHRSDNELRSADWAAKAMIDAGASREQASRAEAQQHLTAALAVANEMVEAEQPLEPTIGDELQGVYADLPSAMLPMVRIGAVPSSFIRRTALTASSVTSSVLAQSNGASSVEENTTLGISAIRANVGSSPWVTTCDIIR